MTERLKSSCSEEVAQAKALAIEATLFSEFSDSDYTHKLRSIAMNLRSNQVRDNLLELIFLILYGNSAYICVYSYTHHSYIYPHFPRYNTSNNNINIISSFIVIVSYRFLDLNMFIVDFFTLPQFV